MADPEPERVDAGCLVDRGHGHAGGRKATDVPPTLGVVFDRLHGIGQNRHVGGAGLVARGSGAWWDS